MTTTLSPADRVRLSWLSARYDFWLDLKSVPRRVRRDLRQELVANVRDAAADIGVSRAIANVGSTRQLARENVVDGELRSAWSAAITAGLTTIASLVVGFLLLSLYYVEGVLDAGADETVSSWLFPFYGSQITVEPETTAGFGFEVNPGPLPFIVGLVVFVAVAKPWRSTRRQSVQQAANLL